MAKTVHELRDPIHGFIKFDNLEKQLIDSGPYQRLREITQLAMSYEVYPGATHKRFEHCIGVMEVASRIFDALFQGRRISDSVADRISEELKNLAYWRSVVRIAALLHDVGHLPFSHAAEKELFPATWNHERMSEEIIRNSELKGILSGPSPAVKVDDVVDIAVDPKKRKGTDLSPWKTILNEILTGNTFGADRIDYLLRDSWHIGVPYGRLDPDRLISGLRIVVDPQADEITLGLDIGSIYAAEALLLSRYFMYAQVYFHDVRRIYDIHLKDFLEQWLPGGKFPINQGEFLNLSDSDVLLGLRDAANDASSKLHELSQRISQRKHFRTVYQMVSPHKTKCPTIHEDLTAFAVKEFGKEVIRSDAYPPKSEANDFLVITDENSPPVSSLTVSSVIPNVPTFEIGLIFAHPDIRIDAKKKIDSRLNELLTAKQEVKQ
jgi:uncharacterized protein